MGWDWIEWDGIGWYPCGVRYRAPYLTIHKFFILILSFGNPHLAKFFSSSLFVIAQSLIDVGLVIGFLAPVDTPSIRGGGWSDRHPHAPHFHLNLDLSHPPYLPNNNTFDFLHSASKRKERESENMPNSSKPSIWIIPTH